MPARSFTLADVMALSPGAPAGAPYRDGGSALFVPHHERDLADVLARFHEGVRLGCLRQRKGLEDHGLHLARREQRPDLLAELARDRRLVGNGARTQRRAGEGQTLAHHRLDVELDLGAAQEGDAHMPTVDGHDLDAAWDIVAADHVE